MVDAAESVPRPKHMRSAHPWKQDERLFGKRIAAFETSVLEILQLGLESSEDEQLVQLAYRILDHPALCKHLEGAHEFVLENAVKELDNFDRSRSAAAKSQVLHLLRLHDGGHQPTVVKRIQGDVPQPSQCAPLACPTPFLRVPQKASDLQSEQQVSSSVAHP